MAKKTDLKFDNIEQFLEKHPHFVIIKEVPAHTVSSPNYGAIRQVLRAGQKLEGVELVELGAGGDGSQNPAAEGEGSEAEDGKRTLRDKLAGKK